jgi:hypothetical protein
LRRALIVATDAYGDTKLARLNAPATDARALAEVLQDPAVGAFEVETVLNQPCHDVEVAIARFMAGGRRGDTLLVHFSCHGVKDLSGELYFATTDTDLKLLKVTGVASSMVKDAIEESRASLILCLVDCCYSGAFTKSTKAAATLDLTERLGGQGRAVITASTSLQLALDGEEEPSLFTRAVVEGLRTGEADRDLDGLVSLDEFYSFVHDRVTSLNPDQTPVKSFDVQGEVYVARRAAPVTTPSPLPRNLLETLATGEVWERRGAVTRLAELLVAGHPGRALAARLELQHVAAEDDSIAVRKDAAAALEDSGDQADVLPEIPEYVDDREPETDEPEPVPELDVEPEREPMPPPDGRPWWKRGVVFAGVLAVVVLGGGIAAYVIFAGDDGAPTLPESELLTVVDEGSGQRLAALDTSTGRSRLIATDGEVFRPTISRDRKRMFYLRGEAGSQMPYRSWVDGTHEEPLLDDTASADCRNSSRPAESPDGTLAIICAAGTADSRIALLSGDELEDPVEYPFMVGAPTWKHDDTLIFAAQPTEGAQARLYELTVGDSMPAQVAGVDPGWASQPDWSNGGLLFGLSQATRANQADEGRIYVLDDAGSSTMLTCSDADGSPTWAPDGARFAFVRLDDDEPRLQVQSTTSDVCSPPREIDVSGTPGPPAWGPR